MLLGQLGVVSSEIIGLKVPCVESWQWGTRSCGRETTEAVSSFEGTRTEVQGYMKEAEPWEVFAFLPFVSHFSNICTFISRDVSAGLSPPGEQAS